MMQHYKDEVIKWGLSSNSTMEDEIIRQRETELLCGWFDKHGGILVLDVGCGNGYTLEVIGKQHPAREFYGVDVSPEMIEVCQARGLKYHEFAVGNVSILRFPDSLFDTIISQRCLINIADWDDQQKALVEIYRVLKADGYYLMIECFTDGLRNYNRARVECGLPAVAELPFNKYLDKAKFLEFIQGKFEVVEWSNFLSSHYFVARVLHALVTKGDQKKNTEFVKFFSYHLPPIGNYSPIQGYLLRKI